MDKQQIMEIILAEEQQLWADVKIMTEHLGKEHESTQRSICQWGAITNLIEKINITNLIDKINEKTN
jgi:hypothetical protein